jgi:hypothetical protein
LDEAEKTKVSSKLQRLGLLDKPGNALKDAFQFLMSSPKIWQNRKQDSKTKSYFPFHKLWKPIP